MITPATVHFTWLPPANGFEWISAHPVAIDWSIENRKTLVLTPKGIPMGWDLYGREEGAYEPLSKASGLFRELAAVEPEPDAVMAFADQYGPLTRGQLFVPVDSKQTWPKPPATCKLAYAYLRPKSDEGQEASLWEGAWHMKGAVSGDSFSYWQENIRALKALVALWDAIGKRDLAAIEKHARLTKRGNRQSIVLVDDEGQIEEPITFTPPSKLTLHSAAEYALIKTIAARIYYTTSIDLFPPGSARSRKLAVVPQSLRDAIWLQFGLAVLEQKKFRSCDVCARPFEVSPQVARTNRTLCSPACKARAHRQRRDQALKLADKGMTARQIAKRVGSQLSTVEKWLKEKKG